MYDLMLSIKNQIVSLQRKLSKSVHQEGGIGLEFYLPTNKK